MSNINCPYDGNFCRKMSVRFEHWQKIVLQDNGLFFPMDPCAFSTCPVIDQPNTCERYRTVSNAENIKQELAQRNAHEQR